MRTLYGNGRIYSRTTQHATAMMVEDGLITWIGDDDARKPGIGTAWVDLDDCFVAPAFVDAHVHLTATGLGLTGLSLGAVRSRNELLDAVERASRRGRGRPIIGGGWDETTWPQPLPPTRHELDRAAYGGSVYLARVDVHSAVVSSALLTSDAATSALAGYRDDGWVSGDAHDAVRRSAYAGLTPAHIQDAQLAALRHAASRGVACVHEMGGPTISSPEDLIAALALGADPSLPAVVGYWGELFGIEAARDIGAVGAGGDLFCDGSLGSHTAALGAPYLDQPDTAGSLRFDTAELAEHIVRCDQAGLQSGFHAIGDAAIDQVLDAFEAASAQLGRRAGIGHRIEHAEFVRDPTRLAASGLIASMQPAFDATWAGTAGMYAQRLGPERARMLNRFADLRAAGVPLAFGSDSPVTPIDPWAAIRAAAHPHDLTARIGATGAFAAHTSGAGRAARTQTAATLEPGGEATFAVWRIDDHGTDSSDESRDCSDADVQVGSARLPNIEPGRTLPACIRTVRRGVTIYAAEFRPG